MKSKLLLLASALHWITAPVFAGLTTYNLNPVDTSLPTINDNGDGIGGIIYGYISEEAWMAFDLSGIPDNSHIVSASLSAYIRDDDGVPSTRTLWYDSDDSWISIPNQALTDPGDDVIPELLVGAVQHDNINYAWQTITITYDNWSVDLADNYISLMMTGPIGGFQSGAIGLALGSPELNWGVLKVPELTLVTSMPAPGAILLGGIGVGFIGFLRRRRQLL